MKYSERQVSSVRILQGTAASSGIAIGPAFVAEKISPHLDRQPVRKLVQELKRMETAFAAAKQEIEQICEKACKGIGEEESMIFQVHIMMLEDETFRQEIMDRILYDHTSAEYAVWRSGRKMYDMFSHLDSEYMRARAEDMADISRRLMRCLDQPGEPEPPAYLCTPVILCLSQAVPSEIAQTNRSEILGFITQYGSTTAHSAILARGMHKPAVLGLNDAFDELHTGAEVIVDGCNGRVILEPTAQVRCRYASLQQTGGQTEQKQKQET